MKVTYGVLTVLVLFVFGSTGVALAEKVDYSSVSKTMQREETKWDPMAGLQMTANVGEVEPNDACPGQALVCGDVLTSATLTPGDVDYIQFDALKDEVLVIGTMSAGGLDPDTKITVFAGNCMSQLAFDDDSGPGLFSLVTFLSPKADTYNVRIEGFDAFTEGDYIAFVSCAPPLPGDVCASAVPLTCGDFSITGTTNGAVGDYDPGEELVSCTGFPATGYDVVYVINDPVFTLSATYTSTADGSIYLVTNCADPEGSCVAGTDETLEGEPETLTYSASAGGPYYLILDNFEGDLGPSGDFTLTGWLECPPPLWVETGEAANLSSGQGVAWGDFDNDGNVDLYLSNYNQNNNIYNNNGLGGFIDTPIPLLNDVGYGRGVAWGDFDNDADLDLYLVNAISANKLFKNQGSGVFTDATSPPIDDAGDGRGVAWGDFDNDGELDLYVVNAYSANKLFKNDGAGGFVDATSPPLDDASVGTGVACADYDNDGDLDIYVANYGEANKLFRNEGAMVFTDVSNALLNDAGNGRGVAWGDFDNDGDLDLYLTNAFAADKLFRNDGGGVFSEVVGPLLNGTGDGRGVAWGDANNDGYLDVYVANASSVNKLLRNDGAGGFIDATRAPLNDASASEGVAWADFDNDGDLDLYVANVTDANRLFRNDQPAGNHWLHVDLWGVASNRAGIGARVRVVAGGMSQIREVSGGSGYLSQNSLTAEFGLGTATLVDTVQVIWPSGNVDDSLNVAVDQRILFYEGKVTPTGIGDRPTVAGRFALYQNTPNPFNPSTVIDYNVATGGAMVTLRIYDLSGRLVRTLVEGRQPQGENRTLWDGTNDQGQRVATGVYFYRMTAPGYVKTRKMVLLK